MVYDATMQFKAITSHYVRATFSLSQDSRVTDANGADDRWSPALHLSSACCSEEQDERLHNDFDVTTAVKLIPEER
jgi:hypothetical protein